MIIDAVYCKKEFVYRIYLGGKIIWDCGSYMSSDALLDLLCGSVPGTEDPINILIQDRIGILHNCESYTRIAVPSIGTPHDQNNYYAELDTIRAKHSDYRASLRILSIGEPAQYGLAFSSGFATTEVDADYICHKSDAKSYCADNKYGLTVISELARASANIIFTDERQESVFQVLPSAGNFANSALEGACDCAITCAPKQSVFEEMHLDNILSDQFYALPTTKMICHVTFMFGDDVIYECTAMEGSDCIDPVESGLIESPTALIDGKRYVFLGWSLSSDGAADVTALNNITDNTVIYAVLEENISGSLDDVSWATISEHSKAGTAEDYYNVGDSKKIRLVNSDNTVESVLVYIAGFNLHRDSSGKKSGITWIAHWRSDEQLESNDFIDHIFIGFQEDLSACVQPSLIDIFTFNNDVLVVDTYKKYVFEPEITNIAYNITCADGTTNMTDKYGIGIELTRYATLEDADMFPIFSGMSKANISTFFNLSDGGILRTRTMRYGSKYLSNNSGAVIMHSRESIRYSGEHTLVLDCEFKTPYTFCFRT